MQRKGLGGFHSFYDRADFEVVRYLWSVQADYIQVKEYMKSNHNFLIHKQPSSQWLNSYAVHWMHLANTS